MIDLTGKTFGRLTVLSYVGEPHQSWLVECSCGVKKTVLGQNLRDGRTESCGCLRKEVSSARSLRHGESQCRGITPEYRAWAKMIERCEDPKARKYENYGGRGIAIDPSFRGPGGYERFLEHVGRRPTSGHSIDRIDSDGNYAPGNLRWSTLPEQNRNRRSNVFVEWHGRRMCLTDALQAKSVTRGRYNYLHRKLNMPPQIALNYA